MDQLVRGMAEASTRVRIPPAMPPPRVAPPLLSGDFVGQLDRGMAEALTRVRLQPATPSQPVPPERLQSPTWTDQITRQIGEILVRTQQRVGEASRQPVAAPTAAVLAQ